MPVDLAAAVAIRRRGIDDDNDMHGQRTVRERVRLVDTRNTVAAVSTKSKNKTKSEEGDAACRSSSQNERKIRFGKVDVKTFVVERGATLLASSRHPYRGTRRGNPVLDRVFAECAALQKAMVMDRFRSDGTAVTTGWPIYWKEPTCAVLFIPSPSCLKKGWWWKAGHVTVSRDDAMGITCSQ